MQALFHVLQGVYNQVPSHAARLPFFMQFQGKCRKYVYEQNYLKKYQHGLFKFILFQVANIYMWSF